MNTKTLAISLVLACQPVLAQEKEPTEKDPISDYLVNVNGGSVSAAGIINLDKSAVRTIQAAQDFALLLKSVSNDENKGGFGIAFTPARTELVPVKGIDYYSSPATRLLSNTTLSYAQNEISVGDKSYRQYGYSVDTYFYFDRDQDPSVAFSVGWKVCADSSRKQNTDEIAVVLGRNLPQAEQDKELVALTVKRFKLLGDCADQALAKTLKWNASRASISLGDGRMTDKSGGSSYGLGKRLTVNAMLGAGDNGAFNLTVQRVSNGVDPDSLKTTPVNKSSTLAGLRYTYAGADAASRTRALLEVSNSKSSSSAMFKDVFMYAAGVEYRVLDSKQYPLWLSLRAGRNRSTQDGKEQTAVLMTLNFQQASKLPGREALVAR